MIVRARGQRDPARVRRRDAVSLGELREVLRRHCGREPACKVVGLARSRAVPSFPDAEQEHHPLDVADREWGAHAVERMCECVCEAALAQERRELVHRGSQGLEVAVVGLREVPDEHVQRHVVFGKPRRDLDREEGVGMRGNPQRAFERVVVADRDVRHAARLARAVHPLRLRVRLTEARPAKRVIPAVRRVDRMNVQIAAAHYSTE